MAMGSHSDEEALDNLLDETRSETPGRSTQGSIRKIIVVSSLVAACIAASIWKYSTPPEVQRIQPGFQFEEKDIAGDTAVEPLSALERNEKRKRLIVEQDLKTLLHVHLSQREAQFRQSTGSAGADKCKEQAERLFDDIVSESAMDGELEAKELDAFKARFASAMKRGCKDIISERLWVESAGRELEQQKPVMTAAIAASLNKAGLGFKTKMHDWHVDESVSSFESRLGMLPTPANQESVLKRKQTRQTAHLPAAFRAELKWPECKEEILKIHNQGHCGSCWAFGGLASIDSRMCIASGGDWDAPKDILSRLHVTSCAPDNYWQGHDGCQGGFPHWPMEMMARTGVASTACLPYYISGEGTEHFEHQDVAPPCETHCQGGYSLPLHNDTFSSAGAANYDWLTHVHGDPTKIASMKTAIYTEGPVAFAFFANHAFMGYHSGVFSVCTGHDQANHAVYAFGWGIAAQADGGEAVEYFEASNSWGTNWGAAGHFRIHPRCITDVTIPGTIESSVVGHLVGIVDADVPRDPDNEFWPWPKPDECPSSDGCVTDMEGSGNYTENEMCVSKALNGKTIRVEQFVTEYGYDIVTINGRHFSGAEGRGLDLEHLNGLEVDSNGIKFQSDFSMNKLGFKLCAVN